MPKSGLSGNYGGLPNSVIRQKNEITAGDEDPYAIDNEWRTILKDVRPDAPFMESDQPRRDNQSESRILLRTEGHRSGVSPDHSDMFLELTEREPRGTALGPDFRKYDEQRWARKDYIKFYPDNDDSVTDWQSTPIQAIRNRVETFNDVKNRLKIFSTGKGSMMAARNFKHTANSNIDLTAGQLPLVSIPESVFENNIDRTAQRSNGTAIGWHRTTDHKFEVARYGPTPTGLKPSRAEINRNSQQPDSFKEAEFRDQRVNAGLAVLMQDILKERESMRAAIPSQMFKLSKQLATTRQKIDKSSTDVSRENALQEVSIIENMMNQLADAGNNPTKRNFLHSLISKAQNSRNSSQVDTTQLANSMHGASVMPGNREHKKRVIAERMSGKKQIELADGLAQHRQRNVIDNGNRKHRQTADITDGMQTMSMKSLKPLSSLASEDRAASMHKAAMASTEGYTSESQDTHYRNNRNDEGFRAGRTPTDLVGDTQGYNHLEGSTYDRSTRGVGSKYMNDKHNTSHKSESAVNDF
jgi:hypothetical protein